MFPKFFSFYLFSSLEITGKVRFNVERIFLFLPSDSTFFVLSSMQVNDILGGRCRNKLFENVNFCYKGSVLDTGRLIILLLDELSDSIYTCSR